MKNEIAIVLAAGMGTRMRPLTDETAKPLLKVDDVPMIETLINALYARGILAIYIIVGYKKEQFNYLTTKYRNVELIENKEYSVKNNISSLKAAESVLGEHNCFICEADLFIKDSDVFHYDFEKSCYFGNFVEGISDDWVFDLSGDKVVNIKKGGNNQYNMCGVSYWLKDDISKMKGAISKSYNTPGHGNMFWDEAVNYILEDINLGIFPISSNRIIEIDTEEELAQLNNLNKLYCYC